MDKKTFFQQFNEAFMKGNSALIMDSVTDDVTWTMVGNNTLHGKAALAEALGEMNHTSEYSLTINHIITHGLEAALDGTIEVTTRSNELQTYGFCDIYTLDKHKNGKIKGIISYVIRK